MNECIKSNKSNNNFVLDITRRKMKSSLFLKEIYLGILRCRFSCYTKPSTIRWTDTFARGHNTASSDSFLKYLTCCNLEYPHVFLTLCVLVSLLLLFFLVLRVLDLLLLFSFHQKMEVLPLFSSGLVAYTWENYWFDTASNDRAAKFMFLDWNKLVANSTRSTLQSCDTEEFFGSWLRLQLGLNCCAFSIDFTHVNFAVWSCPRLYLDFVLSDSGCYALCSIVTRMELFKEMWPVFLDGCRLQ